MGTTTTPPAEPTTSDQPVATAAAAPPIQLRNTYPAGMPGIGNAPPPFGKTPASIAQIMFPCGAKGTHFVGPLLSGPTPGVAGAVGAAKLVLALQVDYSMGPSFNLPIQFPGGCFLDAVTAVTYQNGLTATVSLGTTSGAADVVAAVALPAEGAILAPIPPLIQLPLWDAVAPKLPFEAWLNVSGVSGTAGGSILLISYTRLAAAWSPGTPGR